MRVTPAGTVISRNDLQSLKVSSQIVTSPGGTPREEEEEEELVPEDWSVQVFSWKVVVRDLRHPCVCRRKQARAEVGCAA